MYYCSDCDRYLFGFYYTIKEHPGSCYCSRCYEAYYFHCAICKDFKLKESELDDSDYAELRGLSEVCIRCVIEEKKVEKNKSMAKIQLNYSRSASHFLEK